MDSSGLASPAEVIAWKSSERRHPLSSESPVSHPSDTIRSGLWFHPHPTPPIAYQSLLHSHDQTPDRNDRGRIVWLMDSKGLVHGYLVLCIWTEEGSYHGRQKSRQKLEEGPRAGYSLIKHWPICWLTSLSNSVII